MYSRHLKLSLKDGRRSFFYSPRPAISRRFIGEQEKGEWRKISAEIATCHDDDGGGERAKATSRVSHINTFITHINSRFFFILRARKKNKKLPSQPIFDVSREISFSHHHHLSFGFCMSSTMPSRTIKANLEGFCLNINSPFEPSPNESKKYISSELFDYIFVCGGEILLW